MGGIVDPSGSPMLPVIGGGSSPKGCRVADKVYAEGEDEASRGGQRRTRDRDYSDAYRKPAYSFCCFSRDGLSQLTGVGTGGVQVLSMTVCCGLYNRSA